MIKIIKKAGAGFVALILVLGLLTISPNQLKAAEVSTVSELTSALSNASDGETITLSSSFVPGNVTLTKPAGISVTVDGQNVDFGSYSITAAGAAGGTFTIKNFKFGTASSRAINVSSSALTVFDNILVENRSYTEDGGAMYINSGSSVTIVNSSFLNNSSNGSGYSGGAIAAKGYGATLTIKNSVFIGNKNTLTGPTTGVIGGEGGALWFYNPYSSAKFYIEDSYFAQNEAVKDVAAGKKSLADGGAIAWFNVTQGTTIDVNRVTFDRNIAGDDGGAILIQTNSNITSGITIRNSTFANNIAQSIGDSGPSGGAIQIYANGGLTESRSHVINFTQNTFYGNTAARNGGAIAATGYGIYKSFANIYTNNLFAGNSNSNTGSTAAGTQNISDTSSAVQVGVNIGFDNGTATTVTASQVFGDFGFGLTSYLSNTAAGYSTLRMIVPTMQIKPAGLADNTAGAALSTLDQLYLLRSTTASDVGSREIGFLYFDANGGIFANETAMSVYTGHQYQIMNGTDIVGVYEIADLTGEVLSKPSDPSKSGYTFKGWSLTNSTTETNVILSASELTDLMNNTVEAKTVYAIYADTFTVKYDGNATGVTNVPASEDHDAGASVTVSTTIPVRDGYTFAGWNTSADGSGTNYTGNSTFTMPSNDVTLYAQWKAVPAKYSVVYDGNATGVTNLPGSAQYTEGATATVSTTVPVRDGYTFAGWNTSADGSGTNYTGNSTFTMPSNDVTLYAQWKVIPAKYSVIYDGNTADPVTGIPVTVQYEAGITVIVSSTTPARPGYTFKGWNTVADGSGKGYVGTDTFAMPSNDVTLYAQWQPVVPATYTVLYDGNATGVTNIPGSTAHESGAVVSVSSMTPVRDGYTFKGWNTAADGSGTSYTGNSTFTMPSNDVTLYAQWQPVVPATYTVLYDGNATGVTNIPGSTAHESGAVVSVSSMTPVRDGYTFKGWNTAADGSGTSYTGNSTFTMPSNDVTLYAQWTKNTDPDLPDTGDTSSYILMGASIACLAGLSVLAITNIKRKREHRQ